MVIKNEYKPKFGTNWILKNLTIRGFREYYHKEKPILEFIKEIMNSDLGNSGINVIIRETKTKEIGGGLVIAFNDIPYTLIINSDISKEKEESIASMFRDQFDKIR